jgi:protein ImuA
LTARLSDQADISGATDSWMKIQYSGAVMSSRSLPSTFPERLQAVVWRCHQMGQATESPWPSGFASLDAQLPGGGWSRRVLSELLLPHPGVGEIRLLGPCLCSVQRAGRLVMLFDPPAALSTQALTQVGFDMAQLVIVRTRARVIPGTDSLWALEQALRSGHVGAVAAWLPAQTRTDRLRRLQLAAHAHDGPAFVLRELAAQQRPTPAPLRLALRPGGADVLQVQFQKRRGPPLEQALVLHLPPVLSDALRAQAWRRQRNVQRPAVCDTVVPEPSAAGRLPMAPATLDKAEPSSADTKADESIDAPVGVPVPV